MNSQSLFKKPIAVDLAAPPNNFAVLFIALSTILVVMTSLCIGSDFISPINVIKELTSDQAGAYSFVLETLRLPRIVTALLAGIGLAISGLILQTLVRNPLASPDIIGITGGASVAVVFYYGWLASTLSISWLPVIASFGAGSIACLIYLLSWSKGITPIRLILVGIGISAACGSITTLLMVLSSDTANLSTYTWLTGSVYGSNWQDVKQVLPWVLLPIPIVLSMTKTLDAIQLGDAVATGLGVSVQTMRCMLLIVSVILAGAAVSYAGAISFVGLIAPHIARKIVKGSTSLLIFTAALIGGQLVMIADMVGRTLFGALDLPAGIFVSIIGAPFFIFLLYRQR